MRVPQPTSPWEVAVLVVGGIVGLFVVLPLVPLVLEFVVAPVVTAIEVVVPDGGESDHG